MRHAPTAFLALVLAAGVPCQDPYGIPTPGLGGYSPVLRSGQAWLGNGAFGLSVTNAMGGGTAIFGISTLPAASLFGALTLLIDIQPGNLVLVQPVLLSGAPGAPGAGAAFLPLPLTLPPLPQLAGITFYAQAVIAEAPFGQIAASQGLEIVTVMPPLVFVGTSVGGSNDPTYFIDPLTQTLLWQFTSNANNVTDAEFAHHGRRLYVGLGLGNSVAEVNLETSPPTWSTFYAAPGSVYGVGFDEERDILYALTGSSVSARELVAIDAALGSGSYGQVLGSTVGLGLLNGSVERWELSPDGTMAAVLTVFSPQLAIVNTDPSTAGFMQYTVVGTIPTTPSVLPLAVTPGFTPGNEQILIAVSLGSAGEIARYDTGSATWIDHNPAMPGAQPAGPSSSPPAAVPVSCWDLAVSRLGGFAVVSGFGGGGSVGRLDIDVLNPLSWSYTAYNPGVNLAGAWACDISGDDTMVAVGSFGGGPSQLHLIDAFTGAWLGSVGIPGASNVYTVKYH